MLWQPLPGTSVGLGYRSAVGIDVGGWFRRDASVTSGPAVSTHAEAGLTLPKEVTLSFRQAVAPKWTVLGTVEWTNWSRLGDVAATGSGCGPTRVCEVLNLNYRNGWFYSIGAEYAYTPGLTLRAGVAYETSPITDRTRDILVSDSNRVFLSAGASYQYSEQIILDTRLRPHLLRGRIVLHGQRSRQRWEHALQVRHASRCRPSARRLR